MERRPLKIGILGTRGIPASYGGFETFAEEIGKRFVESGHEVVVYRRALPDERESPKEHLGVKLVTLPVIRHKYLETISHTVLSFLHQHLIKLDVILLCNAANSPFIPLGLFRRPVVVNVDGIERKRSKWNSLGKLWYRFGEFASVKFASKVVSDAKVIADYYQSEWNTRSEIIAYGADPRPMEAGEVLNKFQLKKDDYLLYVSRLEPENNALGVITAYGHSGVKTPLVIVGDAPYSDEYKVKLREAASGKDVRFLGYQFGEAYRELRTNCKLYIQATEVGGTHPALVEGMAYGNAIIANDVPEHREVLEEGGVYYTKNSWDNLAAQIAELDANEALRTELKGKAETLAREKYSWEAIKSQYEAVFFSLQPR